ncbi:MAG: hypothetical protein ACRDRT_15885, partial [Pseudonocardiaceae bacterium]
ILLCPAFSAKVGRAEYRNTPAWARLVLARGLSLGYLEVTGLADITVGSTGVHVSCSYELESNRHGGK